MLLRDHFRSALNTNDLRAESAANLGHTSSDVAIAHYRHRLLAAHFDRHLVPLLVLLLLLKEFHSLAKVQHTKGYELTQDMTIRPLYIAQWHLAFSESLCLHIVINAS